MDVSMECGVCGGSEEVTDIPTLEAVNTVQFSFRAAHDHPDWMFNVAQYSAGGAYQGVAVRTNEDVTEQDDDGDEDAG